MAGSRSGSVAMGIELALVVVVVAALLVWVARRSLTAGRQRIRVDGAWRSYTIHRPSGPRAANAPVLLCFHGGLGRVDRLERQSGLREAALRQGYIVVFPEAPDGWIDARPERGGSRRDLAFVEALVNRLARAEGEPTRFFALGVSNGGMFVLRLAMEQPQRFAGFATVLASIPAAALRSPAAGPPVPIALVFGRQDRIVPWAGGGVVMARRRRIGVGGTVVSAETTLEYWLRRNRAQYEPSIRRMGGAGSPVEVRDYAAAPGGAPVRFVSIAGWGHRWPRWTSDNGSGGFDIADVILEFFAAPPNTEPVVPAEPVRVRAGEI